MKPKYVILFCMLLLFQKYSAQENGIIVVLPGSTVHLSASATNADSYVWFHNGNVIPGAETMYYDATEEGIYWVLAVSEYGCTSDFSEDLQIIFEVPPPTVAKEQEFCIDENPTLSDINVTGENITWYADANTTILLSSSTPLTNETLYYVTQTINGEESEPASVYVSLIDCSDLLSITKTVSAETAVAGAQVTFRVKVKNLSAYAIHDIIVSEYITSGYEYVLHNASNGTYTVSSGKWSIPVLASHEEAILTIRVRVLEHGNHLNTALIVSSDPEDQVTINNGAQIAVRTNCLKIYNEFSPNEDGKNDYFKIDCIESYPNNSLKIYNRWGQLVYEKSNYDNSWKGVANRSSGVIQKGKKLPVGTYFYNLTLGNGTTLTDWLYITR